MTHAEFWSITPAEFAERLDGYHWRQEREWEQIAWLAAHIINISGKSARHRVRPRDLLGKTRNDPIAQAEKMKAVAEKLKKRMH